MKFFLQVVRRQNSEDIMQSVLGGEPSLIRASRILLQGCFLLPNYIAMLRVIILSIFIGSELMLLLATAHYGSRIDVMCCIVTLAVVVFALRVRVSALSCYC